MLVRGSLASRSSSTTSVCFNSTGSCRLNWFIWPGNHDGGGGSAGNEMRCSIITAQETLLRRSVYGRRQRQETPSDNAREKRDRKGTRTAVNSGRARKLD